MVSKLEHVIGELKPKLAEVEDQLKEFDKQYSFANNSFEEGVDAVGSPEMNNSVPVYYEPEHCLLRRMPI